MDEKIIALFKTYDSYWNQRNADAYCGLFTEDASAIFFTLNGEKMEMPSRKDIHSFYVPRFKDMETRPGVRHNTHITRIQHLNDQVILIDGDAHIAEHQDFELTRLRNWAVSFVIIKTTNDWHIASLRACERPIS